MLGWLVALSLTTWLECHWFVRVGAGVCRVGGSGGCYCCICQASSLSVSRSPVCTAVVAAAGAILLVCVPLYNAYAAEGLDAGPLLAGNALVFSGVCSSSAGAVHTVRLGWCMVAGGLWHVLCVSHMT
jgi:hypothetical protein